MLVWLLACDGPASDGKAPAADTDTDADTDSDTDTDTDVDTGVGALEAFGEIRTSDGAFESAELGKAIDGVAVGDRVCTLTGPLTYTGPGPDGCPDCEWAFEFSGIAGSMVEGEHCSGPGWTWRDGDLDQPLELSIGFTYSYAYDYGGSTVYFDDVLLVYEEGYDWFAFASGDPDSSGGGVSGDATDIRWSGIVSDSYYYYYR
jgi:hypothetical protein